MPTTSGTYNAELLTVNRYIEQAFSRCGKTSSTISGEQQLNAKLELYLLLLTLANRGLSLWCIERRVLGLKPASVQYYLPAYTVDVLQALYRKVTLLTGSVITGVGWTGLDLGAGNAKALYNAAVQLPADSSPTLIVEGSADGVSWKKFADFYTDAIPANTWACCDLNNSETLQYWRVRDTSTVPVSSYSAANFGILPYEIPMTKLNRDDYIMLPNKTFSVSSGQQSLQYWYDKSIAPSIWVWPESQSSQDQMVIWTQRQIQDVGDLTDILDVPARWQPYVLAELAYKASFLLPGAELPPGRMEVLQNEAEKALSIAEDGETDGAPIRFALGIRGYTR